MSLLSFLQSEQGKITDLLTKKGQESKLGHIGHDLTVETGQDLTGLSSLLLSARLCRSELARRRGDSSGGGGGGGSGGTQGQVVSPAVVASTYGALA